MADCHALSAREAPLQVGRLNLWLMLARDAAEGHATMPEFLGEGG